MQTAKPIMTHKPLNAVIWILTALTFVYVAGTLVVDATKVHRWMHSGSIETEFSTLHPGDTVLVATYVDPTDFVNSPAPFVGDTLVAILGTPVSTNNLRTLVPTVVPVGFRLEGSIRHHGVVYTGETIAKPVSEVKTIAMIILYLLRGLVGFGFILVGVWALYFRADNDGARVLTLFCLAMALYLLKGFAFLPDDYASFMLPFAGLFQLLFLLLITYLETFWLHLQLVFPHKHKFLMTKPALKYSALYSLQTISMALQFFQNGRFYNVILIYIQLVFVVQIGTGLFILWNNYRTSQPGLERRQLKLVLMGSAIGMASMAIWLSINTMFRVYGVIFGPTTRIIFTNCAFTVLLATPASYAYAMGRYRLLDVEARLRRGTRYLLVTGLLSVVVFTIVYFISGTLLQYAKVTERAPTLIIAILFTLGITPTQKRIQLWLEQKFYPERSNLRRMFTEFVQTLGAIPDRDTLWNELKTLLTGLYVEQVVPALRKSEAVGLREKTAGSAPFQNESEFIKLLESGQKPLMVDEILDGKRISVLPEEKLWLHEQKIALILPMNVHGRLIGFIGLGFKSDQQDFSPHDMTILSSLGSQIALAHENLRLREESIEKKRLEEQLAIAREIQLGFLPRSIPKVKGMSVAAKSVFCVEVAGDYYDVFELPGERTVLAIGDVVGKGAGAAMLMANLQASFRTAIEGDEPLNAIIRRINGHILRNTSPEQFITFFAGIYDHETREFQYVNAGHNPPQLIRTDGKVEELFTGGVLLGTVRKPNYDIGRVTLAKGDLIILYTDGITEAMNDNGEEFEVERMIAAALPHRDNAEQAVSAIHEAVVTHHGGDSFDDDFTLIVAKVE